jgi:hypothetical protein
MPVTHLERERANEIAREDGSRRAAQFGQDLEFRFSRRSDA